MMTAAERTRLSKAVRQAREGHGPHSEQWLYLTQVDTLLWQEGVSAPEPLTVEPVQVDLMTAADGAWLIRFATPSATILLDPAQWQELRATLAQWEQA